MHTRSSRPLRAAVLAALLGTIHAPHAAAAVLATFDFDDATGAFEKVAEELEEVREAMGAGESAAAALEEELGDLLFAVVNLARLAGAHALTALHDANAKFSRRFEALERLAAERGMALEDAGLEALDGLWDEIKAREG